LFSKPLCRKMPFAGRTAFRRSLVFSLLVKLALATAGPPAVTPDTVSGGPDSISSAVGIDSLILPGPGDSASNDSTQESPLIGAPVELTDSLVETDTSAPALSPVDTGAVAEDSLPQAVALDTAFTMFTEPQSDNPLALRYNGIYISGSSLTREERIEEFIEKSHGTPIGGFVIDMKDDHGRLSYTSRLPLAAEIGANTRRLRDPEAFVQRLHEEGLIACARVVSFKDPFLANYLAGDSTYPYAVLDSATNTPWQQNNGEYWANPYDERVHDYLLGVIGELAGFGFDQIQLDYIRFPSDGRIERCSYPMVIDSLNRADVMGLFLSKVRSKLDGYDVSLAVDIFGWVPWLHKNRNYWIGQDYDLIAGHVDVICPMLYPSHFPKEFKEEFKEKRAYYIVREGTLKGVERRGRRSTGVQPYIQGFKWRAPYFGSLYLIDQMRAARESGAIGWIVWNAANNYSALWEALDDETSESDTQ